MVAAYRLGQGVKALVIINCALYLVLLGFCYAVEFHPGRIVPVIDFFALSNEGLFSGRVWQLVTHLFLHSLDSVFHLVFNMLVLYWFGREMEARWGTKRFLVRYFVFGFGGAAAIVLWNLVDDVPALGASGAISGILCAFCLYHWDDRLRLFFIELSGKGWLLVFIVLDFVRLIAGEPLAVQGHLGGMLTAAVVIRRDAFSPRLLWLRFKRWRLKRRLRIERGGGGGGDDDGGSGGNGDERYLH